VRSAVLVLLVLGLCAAAARGAEEEGEEEEDLRERLTEREDKRRPERSWSTLLADRPLTLSGELALEPYFVRRRVLGDPDVRQRDRLLSQTGLELEAFYSFSSELSLFGQGKLVWQRDLLPDVRDEISDVYVEPGEIWLYSEDVAGTGLDVDLGRLDFEDERRWWWDDELEAARLAFEGDEFELSLALAHRLFPERSDRSWIEPDEERVTRAIAHAARDLWPSHGVELFAVHADDRSPTEGAGEIVKTEREDESDARLRWLGARATGVFDLRPTATLGYWLDLAWLRGSERRVDYEDEIPGLPRRSEVESVRRRRVRGFAYDAGASVALTSVRGEPRIFGGHARASRDFRQTGLEGNEAGFGGVERFPSYGILLEPEFSNLDIHTFGAGVSLLRSSSLDLVYHRYRLRSENPASVPGIELVAELEPRHADLGQAIDLVLALEEWERLEFAFAFAVFRAGRAFERSERGETSLGGFFAVHLAF
jgi:hypothetical protein